MTFEPTRSAGLERLHAFVPKAGRSYAERRNYDLKGHPHVSGLSPYIRHRLITEDEVLRAVLDVHDPREADKFIVEVYWRTYWKGWLELRPSVWMQYRADLDAAWNRVQTEAGLRRDWEAACKGDTGIDCFDHWAQELVATGYLHNHARMWFASIWIFTLRLPWVLGADFFLRHLLDGDPASNTLSWRWVGGLQTLGKTYLADADNIARYTNGRFRPTGLAKHAVPLAGHNPPPAGPCPVSDVIDPKAATAVLTTHEDLVPLPSHPDAPRFGLALPSVTGPLQIAPQVQAFRDAALADALPPDTPVLPDSSSLISAARNAGITQLICAYVPVGPGQDTLNELRKDAVKQGLRIVQQVRPSDLAAWPRAKAGFFKFKTAIPDLLRQL